MLRRDFITLLGGATTWPVAARAQQASGVRRIGLLLGYVESDPRAQSYLKSFVQSLEETVVEVFGCRHAETIPTLRRPASEKRQGTKSREVGHRRSSECYGDL